MLRRNTEMSTYLLGYSRVEELSNEQIIQAFTHNIRDYLSQPLFVLLEIETVDKVRGNSYLWKDLGCKVILTVSLLEQSRN
jgi:regulator of sigma D